MTFLQLTIFVWDFRTNIRQELSFVRSPVIVGRDAREGISLEAPTVSRRHGEFRFGNGGVQYVDLDSTNGTYIDGIQIEPNVAVEVRESSLIDVLPYRIVVHAELISRRRRVVESRPDTAVARIPRSPPPIARWSADLARSASIQRLFIQHGPAALFRRAAVALEILAAFLQTAKSTGGASESPLLAFESSAEFVAHLIDPAGEEERLDDLRDVLAALLQRTQSICPEGTS